ncbi:MAG: hypothetical protein WAN46_02410, partial [Gammaproteobacteria bacterium]
HHQSRGKTVLGICRQSIALPQGCVQQGCWTQVYKDVFTTSLEARRLTATSAETMTMAGFPIASEGALASGCRR